MSILVIIGLIFLGVALYLLLGVGSLVGAIVAAVIGLVCIAASQNGRLRL